MKKKTFKDYFKFPLKFDDFDISYIWTDNNQMAMNFITYENLANDEGVKKALEDKNNIIAILNGDIKGEYTDVSIDKDTIVCIDNKPKLIIRGWGMLTGTGGYKLSTKNAVEIQDAFRDYIVKKLKGEDE